MPHPRLELDEKLGIFRVVASLLGVVSREATDGVHRLPMRQQEKVRLSVLEAAKQLDPTVAGGRPVARNTGPLQILGVGLGLGFRGRCRAKFSRS